MTERRNLLILAITKLSLLPGKKGKRKPEQQMLVKNETEHKWKMLAIPFLL